jgi:hypothetical protein
MAATFGVGRAIFRAMVPDLYSIGMSANAMIREARRMGTSYQRQTMLSDIRDLTGRLVKQYQVERVARDRVAPRSALNETELSRARKYFVTAQADFRDLVTGETFTKNIAYYSDELKTFDQWDEDFSEWSEAEQYRMDLEFITQRPLSISHNAGWSY